MDPIVAEYLNGGFCVSPLTFYSFTFFMCNERFWIYVTVMLGPNQYGFAEFISIKTSHSISINRFYTISIKIIYKIFISEAIIFNRNSKTLDRD